MIKFKDSWRTHRPKNSFSEENWKRWSNANRWAFIENQIDVLTRDNNAIGRKLDVTDEIIAEMKKDAADLRKLAEAEHGARQMFAASAQDLANKSADSILNTLDKSKSKAIYLPPNAILGKKGN